MSTRTPPTPPPKGHVDHDAVHVALSLFTSKGGRYSLQRPWTADGWVYTSDGRTLARVPSWAAPWVTPTDIENRIVPSVLEMPWERERYEDKRTDIPELPKLKIEPCEACFEGATLVDRTVWFMMGDTEERHACPKCGMFGAPEVNVSVKVGKSIFGSALLRRLASIGADLYAPKRPGRHNLSAWWWEMNGICMDGFLMPRGDV